MGIWANTTGTLSASQLAAQKAQGTAMMDSQLAMAAATVINGAMNTLMTSGSRKQQIESLQLNDRLGQLSAQQKYALALKLQSANTDAQRMQLLTDAVSQIDIASANANAKILTASVNTQAQDSMTTAIIVGGSLIALIGAYFVTKNL